MATENTQPTDDAASNGGEVNSPQSRRRSLPSPWASVVRGDPEQNSLPAVAGVPASSLSPPSEQSSASDSPLVESSGSEALPESADVNGDSNAGRPRRPAWNRPVNGAPEPATVMGGAVSWPALSETTRSVTRSSTEGSRPVSDGSASSSQAPIISPPPQRPSNNNNNTYSNPTGNNSIPSRPRRNRGGGSSSVSGTSHHPLPMPPPPPPPFHVFEGPYGMVPPVRGPRAVRGVGGSHSHVGNDHSQRNNSRRVGYGPRPRGDGTLSNNHGGRHDQERRDIHRPPHYLPPHMGYVASPLPPGAGPFIPSPPVRLFPGQMGFDTTSPFIYVPTMSMPMVPPPPPYYPPPDPIISMIVKQVDFYFSDDNLAKDKFLRSKMDEHGWVSITVIASFRRIDLLTKDIPLILDSLRYSTVVEVQDGKVRRRHDWRKYLPPPGLVNSDVTPTTSTPSERELATALQEVSLDNSTTSNTESTRVHAELTTGLDLSQPPPSLAIGEGTPEENCSISV